MQNILKTTILHWTTMFFFIANKWSGVLHCRSVCNTIQMCVCRELQVSLRHSTSLCWHLQEVQELEPNPIRHMLPPLSSDLIWSNPTLLQSTRYTLLWNKNRVWTRSDKTSVSTPIQPSVLIRLVKTVHVGLCQLQYLDGTVPVTQWERQKV